MKTNIPNSLNAIIKTLPEKPGVYQYFSKTNEIIYIGKARNLKKRVSSYFNKSHDNLRLQMLIDKIVDIKYISVDTESDALFLENTLIKQYKPRYNILLKDDKTYPWICISKEPFPRIFTTRNVLRNGTEYYGPYTSTQSINTLLECVNQIYQLRSCHLFLTPEKIAAKKYRVCLEYHLGNCAAPCVGKQSRESYLEIIHNIREIIRGHIKDVVKVLYDSMMQYADLLEFEKAQLIKKKYDQLKQYQSKSIIVNSDLSDLDVFSISITDSDAIVNFMEVVQGVIVKSQIMELKKKMNETPEKLLGMAVIEMRQQNQSTSKEIIVPFVPNAALSDVSYIIPRRGDKFKLLELSNRNLRMHQLSHEKMQKLVDPESYTKRIMDVMKSDLRMNVAPTHIECFDNSNIQGAYPVAAMAVFKNGKPSKKDYRHFNIKTVKGPDDFASMEEIIYRRYHRLLEEKKELPQLIIVDGGKGQLSTAINSLKKLNLYGIITIISIAKRLEEIYFPNDSFPIYIDKTSPTLKIIQQLRDEAHRFGITHHRNQRSKGALAESLTQVPGIGTKTAELLLRQAGSLKRIKAMHEKALCLIIGKAKAKILIEYFKKEDDSIVAK